MPSGSLTLADVSRAALLRSAAPAFSFKPSCYRSSMTAALLSSKMPLPKQAGKLRKMRAAQIVGADRCPLRTIGRQQAKQFGNRKHRSVAGDQIRHVIAPGPVAAGAGDCQVCRAPGDSRRSPSTWPSSLRRLGGGP
jgi:hypothetical protein